MGFFVLCGCMKMREISRFSLITSKPFFHCRLLHGLVLKYDYMRMLPYSTTERQIFGFTMNKIFENSLKNSSFFSYSNE